MNRDESWMEVAIAEARKGLGQTEPNPAVGAVIVESDQMTACGYHAKAGQAHAEIKALENLGRPAAQGAEMFVTLEPCSTQGKTGPCTEAIIASGIKRVIIGATDPNPLHRGRGIDILKSHGIEVVAGVLASRCEELNPEFNRRMKEK